MSRPFAHKPLFAPLAPLALTAGSLAFTLALTPSLIPRTGALQGALAGASFIAVYALVVMLGGVLHWLGLPRGRPGWLHWTGGAAAAASITYGLASVTDWQNAVNAAAGLPPVETARPFIIAAMALAIIAPALALGRVVQAGVVVAANRMAHFLPDRLALTGALLLTATLFWTVGNGVLGGALLRTLDSGAQQVDALILADMPVLGDPLVSGSAESLLDWDSLGAAGRARVSAFPNAAQIAEVAGTGRTRAISPEPGEATRSSTAPAPERAEALPVLNPIRIYVGLNAAETPEERAALALAELLRTDAFSREIMVIATPTGTGMIHPSSLSSLEFLWRGDVASVSVQYSYLPSWLALLVDPDYGAETARAVFTAIHDHWRRLPPEARPRLYLHGLSLGSLNSELSADVWNILAQPYDGAFWVGPTFTNPLWQQFTARRNPGSPAWRPVVGSGSLVRFATQEGIPDHGEAPWGPVRILYLQYPSDAITFFSPDSLWSRPDWLDPRAPDVSPAFRWVPVVTMLQLFADLVAAFRVPVGVGHAYAAAHYIEGWMALTEPPDWDEENLRALREFYAAIGR